MTTKYSHGQGSSGQYNADGIELTDGQQAELQLDSEGRLITNATVTATFVGPQEVIINQADDSIAIGSGTTLFTGTSVGGGHFALDVNSTGTSTVSGTVSTNLNGLTTFQTSQYAVGTSAVQLTPTPLANRKSMSVKAILTGNNVVYVGNSSGVTSSTGYPLFNGDSVQLDITGSATVYAIATAAAQTIAVVESG